MAEIEPCGAAMVSKAVENHMHTCTRARHPREHDHYCNECQRHFWLGRETL